MASKTKKVAILWTDGLEYDVPIPAKKEDVIGWDLPKKQQMWRRLPVPNFSLMNEAEKVAYFETELERKVTGIHFMNNGTVEYITGNHYWFLQHWNLGGSKYPRFFNWHKHLAYFMDLCRKDPNCFGGQVLASKRGGKSEFCPCEFLSDAMLQEVATYIIQAQNDIKSKKLFRRTLRAFQSQKRSLPYMYQHFTTNNEILFKNALSSKKTTKKVNKDDIAESDHVSIGAYPSKIDFIQGETTRGIFMDEYCSQEQMDMVEWFDTAIAQCSEGIGKKIIGKIWLIATPERAKSKSLPFAERLYDRSNPKERDENGRTKSGLYRMLVPYYESTPDFLDEYGYSNVEDAKKFFENMCAGKSPDKIRELKRKYISCKDDAFDPIDNLSLEAETKDILRKRLTEIKMLRITGKAHNIYEYNGQLTCEPVKDHSDYNEEENIVIFEQPQHNCLYSIGVDGTATDDNTSESDDQKSKFAVVVTKLFDPNPNGKSYCDVAEFVIRPEKMELCYKKLLLLTKYYNIHAGINSMRKSMTTVMAEGNAGAAPAVVGYFESAGCLHMLRKQPKYLGSDNKEEMNRYCIYKDGTVAITQLFLTNQAVQLYGHNFNSKRLIEGLLAGKTDIGDAFKMAVLGWGAFHQPKKEKPKVVEYTYVTKLRADGTFQRTKVEQKQINSQFN